MNISEEYLYNKILYAGEKGLMIPFDIISDITFFNKYTDIPTIENVLLAMNNHTTIKSKQYDYKSVQNWCNKYKFKCKEIIEKDSVLIWI